MKRRTTTHIVFHTAAAGTASRPGDPSAADIDRWHRERGWSGIGYHYVIRKDGTVEAGRPEGEVGAHCIDGGMNRLAVGVCLSGHHNHEDWTEAQWSSFLRLVAGRGGIMERHAIPVANVIGHREAGAKKDCPGTHVSCGEVRRRIAAYRRVSLRLDGTTQRIEPRPPAPIPTPAPSGEHVRPSSSAVTVPVPPDPDAEASIAMTTQPPKPWYKSVTIWGTVAAMISLILGTFFSVDVAPGEIETIINGVVGVVGALLAILGRLRATQPIG